VVNNEISRGRFRFTAMEQVIFGSPAAETIAREAERLSAERVGSSTSKMV
jgi:hypothetical protein